ncbi:MAG: hypothetical protein RIC14_14665 [Filomicrobium sp.]
MVAVLGTPATAQERKDSSILLFGTDDEIRKYESKSAQELMADDEYQGYQGALERKACSNAEEILNKAFIRTFPEYSHLKLKKCELEDCLNWGVFSRRFFKPYGFCVASEDFKKSEQELLRENSSPPKFSRSNVREEPNYDDRRVAARDLSLSIIVGQAQYDYVPALLKIVELIRRGDVFHAGAEVEYYLLQRVCVVSVNCEAHQSRLHELEKEFGADRSNELATLARASEDIRPSLHKILVDGVVKERLPRKKKDSG